MCPKGRLRRDASRSLTATRRLTAGIPTRTAAQLTGVCRAAVGTTPRRPLPVAPPSPANRLSAAERAQVITALDSPRFVDQPPLQVYAQLVEEGTYLCLVSTMYRVLAENRQVRERRRRAVTRPGPGPSSSRPAVYSWDIERHEAGHLAKRSSVLRR
ncbi:MAG: hypothetical protein ACYDDU_00420 [Dermatophilaceae bacterium]